ncbi:MAG: hypothetical protein KDI33_09630 [Halioglobus sp.]|nr:hypothetical protein [Halioglobus sp.]
MFQPAGCTRNLPVLAFVLMLVACSHPLEIVGSGDIVASGTGGSSCDYESAPCPNLVVGAYSTTYTAVPREDYGFLGWYGCPAPQGNQCSFAIKAPTVYKFWGQTALPLRAIFSPEVSLGNLSGDFAASTDCQGHVFSPNPEVVFRFREATGVTGENQKQCMGNTILADTATGKNYLVWLDILHINDQGEAVSDAVNGTLPIREIYATYTDPFIVGKTYTLEGIGFSAGPSIVSIQITWLDLDADFNGHAHCIVTESQSPIGAPARRKTYCPRFDGGYEIKENVAVVPGAPT